MENKNFHNSSFKDDITNGKISKELSYDYFIEYDHDYEFWELSISYGDDLIENYSYMNYEEVEQDIDMAFDEFNIEFNQL